MKNIALPAATVFAILLAAAGAAYALTGGSDSDAPPAATATASPALTTPVTREAAIGLVATDLAHRTGAEPILVSAEPVEWPDTSLGNPQPGMFYAQVITPGYKIILEADSHQYEYHTDLTGSFTLLD